MTEQTETTTVKEDKRIHTMAAERPVKAVLKMGIPVTVGMLFMVFYNLADTYFIGLLHDDYQLAAVNLAYPVMMVLVAIAGIVGNGGASYIARCLGAKETEKANHTLTIGFELTVLSGLALTVLGIVFLNPIVTLLGAKASTFFYTKQYVRVMFIGAVFTMGNYAIGQLLRSEGSTTYSMIGMVAGTAANIILDPIFIFGFKLEILGAAIATILGNIIGILVFLYYYARRKTLLRPSAKLLKLDKAIIGEIMWVGIPHTLEQFFTTAALLVNNNLAAAYGGLTVAAMGVSGKLMSFGNYIYQGFAAGCQPLMGYNYGAGNYRRMRSLIKAGIGVTTVIELGVIALYGLTAPFLIGLFTDSAEVISVGAKTLRAAMLMLPFVSVTSLTRNTYNAIGKPFYAFGITVIRQLALYIPFLLLFNSLWGYNGLICAQPAEELLCAVISWSILTHTFRKLEQREHESRE